MYSCLLPPARNGQFFCFAHHIYHFRSSCSFSLHGRGNTRSHKVSSPPQLPTTAPVFIFIARIVQLVLPLSAFNIIEFRVKPFLTQSDSASRKRLFSTGRFFDWILLVLLLIVSRVDSIVFVLFLEAVGVREYCCTAGEIGWQLCASRFLRKQRLGEPSSQRVGGFGLSRKPPKLRSWSCTQPRAAKATAAAAVVGSM